MGPQFHETGYGRKFLEGDFPNFIYQLTRIADALEMKKKEPESNLEEAYKDIQEKLMTQIDEWFANLDGMSLGRITGYNPDDYLTADKLTDEEESKELTRDDAIDIGRDVWNAFCLDEKLEWQTIINTKQEGL